MKQRTLALFVSAVTGSIACGPAEPSGRSDTLAATTGGADTDGVGTDGPETGGADSMSEHTGSTGGSDSGDGPTSGDSDPSSGSGTDTGEIDPDAAVWPNEESQANSDPWIAQNHQSIEQMRPRVLAINYVNARSMADMNAQLEQVIDIIAESTRYHGYEDADAPPFLAYELAYSVDLRDAAPPPGWTYNNSTLYPREDPPQGYWGFDYAALFSESYADLLAIEDPDQPGHNLRLCEAIDRGLVHEVWVYGDADVPDVSAAEMLELKPEYDENFERVPGAMNPCAGNGCFDQEDLLQIPCTRSVRVAWFNNTRGPGCFMESLSHAFEGMGRKGQTTLPYLSKYFPEFANMQLSDDHGLAIDNWYSCPYGEPCLSYPSSASVTYDVSPEVQGTIEDYDARCGNVHWPPNARHHYDLDGPDAVVSSCTHWRDGTGETEPYDGSQHDVYRDFAPDCMGPFLVWWRQNIPGLHNTALDDDGQPMRNWWPFLFY